MYSRMNTIYMPLNVIIAGGRSLASAPPDPFVIFGIVNATPDSFFDGTGTITPAAAIARARRVWKQGAHVLDIGGESTRPHALPVPPAEELARVLPVLRAARAFAPSPFQTAPILSVDTRHAETAAAVLAEGAHIINDVSGCADPAMPAVLALHKPGYVLTHAKDNPCYADVVGEIRDFFARALSCLTAAGLPEDHVLIDPGIGFGKRLEHNLAILRDLPRLLSLGRPLLLGLSNKSLFGDLLGLQPGRRGPATQTLTALTYAQGVAFHRVHDARGAREALMVSHTFLAAQASVPASTSGGHPYVR